jgi:hypothetical protein
MAIHNFGPGDGDGGNFPNIGFQLNIAMANRSRRINVEFNNVFDTLLH